MEIFSIKIQQIPRTSSSSSFISSPITDLAGAKPESQTTTATVASPTTPMPKPN